MQGGRIHQLSTVLYFDGEKNIQEIFTTDS